jgi:hypothetical protein
VIKLATKAEASKVEQWHVLDVYKDTKNLFGRAIVKELVVEGDSISARVMWDDGDSDNLMLLLYSPSSSPDSWPRWRPSELSKVPLLVRIHTARGDLMRDPRCADVKAPLATATPTGVFGAALDTSMLENNLLATGLAGAFTLDIAPGLTPSYPILPHLTPSYPILPHGQGHRASSPQISRMGVLKTLL